MFIRSLGIAAGLSLVGTAASQATVPSVDDQAGLRSKTELTLAVTPGDVGDPILVARRGADDRSGHDRHDDKSKHKKEKHKGGKDDGPGHV